jgi:hypothetical protein
MRNIKKKDANWGEKKGRIWGCFFCIFQLWEKTLQRRRLIGEFVTMVELEKRIIIILYTVFSLFFSLSLVSFLEISRKNRILCMSKWCGILSKKAKKWPNVKENF